MPTVDHMRDVIARYTAAHSAGDVDAVDDHVARGRRVEPGDEAEAFQPGVGHETEAPIGEADNGFAAAQSFEQFGITGGIRIAFRNSPAWLVSHTVNQGLQCQRCTRH